MKEYWVFYVLILTHGWVSVTAQVVGQTPNNGFFNSIFNSIQLGFKNLVDQLVPNIQLPSPAGSQDVQIGELTIPSLVGSGQVKLTNCPNCYNLDTFRLNGVWHLLYANDNFLKTQMYTLGKLADGYYPITFNSNGNVGESGPAPNPPLFNPIRYPVCAKLTVFSPVPNGMVIDFPIEFSWIDSRPHGAQKRVQGLFRQVNDGKYLMAFENGRYYIRFCPASTNIFDMKPYKPLNPNNPNRNPPANNVRNNNSNNFNGSVAGNTNIRQVRQVPDNHGSKYLILGDVASFPGCNNYAVFTTDVDYYWKNFDNNTQLFIDKNRGDTDSNPLRYLGCPCGRRE